ncbi:nucleotide exchange factor GrpE [bacterium]|nr:nucleotide exchange factor GrpE [bacterium]
MSAAKTRGQTDTEQNKSRNSSPQNEVEQRDPEESSSEKGFHSEEDRFELTEVEEKLQQALDENDRLRDQMLRARAEFENYKRRRSSDITQLTREALEGVLSDMLPVLDDFDLLLNNAESSKDKEALISGAKMIQKKLHELLEKRGLERLDAQGKAFDPDQHEALMQHPSAEVEPGTVIMVHQPGYKLGDKLLRPSRVVVATNPETGD